MRMQTTNIVSKLLAVGAVLGLVVVPPAQACTGIELIAVDGTVVHARTLEFGIDLKSNVIMVGVIRARERPLTANPARRGPPNTQHSALMPSACRCLSMD